MIYCAANLLERIRAFKHSSDKLSGTGNFEMVMKDAQYDQNQVQYGVQASFYFQQVNLPLSGGIWLLASAQ